MDSQRSRVYAASLIDYATIRVPITAIQRQRFTTAGPVSPSEKLPTSSLTFLNQHTLRPDPTWKIIEPRSELQPSLNTLNSPKRNYVRGSTTRRQQRSGRPASRDRNPTLGDKHATNASAAPGTTYWRKRHEPPSYARTLPRTRNSPHALGAMFQRHLDLPVHDNALSQLWNPKR